ncbi:MAG TPA: transcriptional regulator NrdR [Candidatus Saccharimonas sp.]|jgi:transcriptional repressor NrdR|nr:transcriptional regulator NrdR [Candidatus Saccharimonas sp.]
MGHSYKIGDSRVLESRESADGITIRRRRETMDGKHRFTTYERIEHPNLAVIKKDGSRELFDREKLSQAIRRSVGKFFKSEVEIDDIINEVEERLYELGENEVPSRAIGDNVLDELAARNEVAYVRFASVFHKFETLDDFVKILEQRKTGRKDS